MSDRDSDRADRRTEEEREGGDKPGFKVIDRRRFSADGSERGPDEEPPPAAAPSERRAPAPGPVASPPSAEPSDPELAMPQGAPYDEPHAPFEASFGTLLISLSTQALMYLGEIPSLEGGEAHKDLAAARNIIDLIAVLERKTAGNLDADEAALLERILYDLRMRFVEISRG
jgi:hypothetical protein